MAATERPPLRGASVETRVLAVPGVTLPAFTGGAVGFVGYDCVRFFEPRVAPAICAQPRVLDVPDVGHTRELDAAVHAERVLGAVRHGLLPLRRRVRGRGRLREPGPSGPELRGGPRRQCRRGAKLLRHPYAQHSAQCCAFAANG